MVSYVARTVLVGSLVALATTGAHATPTDVSLPNEPLAIVRHVAPAHALIAGALPLVRVGDGHRPVTSKTWTLVGAKPDVEFPAQAGGPLRLRDLRRPGATLTVTAVDVLAGTVRPDEAALVHLGVSPGTDLVRVATRLGAEELRILHAPSAAKTSRFVLELGPAYASARLVGGRVEIVDTDGRVAIESPAPRAWDVDGHEVPVTVSLAPSAPGSFELQVTAEPRPTDRYPLIVDPTWQYVPAPDASLYFLAQGSSWTALPDGSALIVGGLGFDPVTFGDLVHDQVYLVSKTLELVAQPKVPGPRWGHAAAAVGSTVVLAGGNAGGITTPTELSSVVAYDTAKKSWKTLPNLQRARQSASALALKNGKVLVLGGSGGGSSSTLLDIVDPAAGTTTKGAPMASSRIRPAMTELADGRVFVAGGLDYDSEIYDPATNVWSTGPKFPAYLDRVDVHRLPSGQLLVVPLSTTSTKTTYVVDAALKAAVEGPPMTTAHANGASTQLLDGRVLVTGGEKGTTPRTEAELFDESKGAFAAIEPLDVPRFLPVLVTLADGRVLVGRSPPGVMNVLLGGKCDNDAACATGTCADGRCCGTACDGRCQACDVPGSEGTCSPLTGKEREVGHASCAPYGTCSAGACVHECKSDADCAKGAVCYASGTCAPPRAICDGAHTVTDKETGRSVDCAPYRCASAGDCKKSCTSSADCAPSAACADGRCAFNAAAADDGGCSTGRRAGSPFAFVGFLLAAVVAWRRRLASASVAASVAATGCGAEPTKPDVTATASQLDVRAKVALLERFPRVVESPTPALATPRLSVAVPRAASDPLRIARVDRPTVWIEIRAIGDAPTKRAEAGAFVVLEAARPATDVFFATTADRAEELRLLHDATAPTVTTYRVTHGPGVSRIRARAHRFEVLDADDHVVLGSEPIWAQDQAGVVRDAELQVTALADAHVLSVTLDTRGLAFPVVLDPAWRATGLHRGSLLSAAATQLASGNVITLTRPSGGDPAAQLYEAATYQWKTAGTPTLARTFAAAVPIGPTRALFVGGGSYSGSTLTALRTVDVYDETTNAWTTTDGMVTARSNPWLFALPGSRVMVLGGNTGPGHVSTSEIYDVASGKWSAGPSASALHSSAHPVVLPDGRWLMVDGKRSEVFDPKTMTWAPIALPPASIDVTALLPDGRVLAVGGKQGLFYDPKTNAWSDAPATSTSHAYGATFATLRSGALLLLGGNDEAFATVATVDRFDPGSSKWTSVQPLPERREGAFAFTLPKGEVLVFGGTNDDIVSTLSPLLFNLENGLACAKDEECASGFCTDGVCCDTRCRGACDACDGAKKGTCSPSDAPPKKGHGSCDPFAACKAGKCVDACTTDAECVAGSKCFTATGKCTDKGSTCDGDHTITLPSGSSKDCTPYRCAPSGDCTTVCATSADCVAGAACDDGICHELGAAPADQGGCTTGPSRVGGGWLALLLLPWLGRRGRRLAGRAR